MQCRCYLDVKKRLGSVVLSLLSFETPSIAPLSLQNNPCHNFLTKIICIHLFHFWERDLGNYKYYNFNSTEKMENTFKSNLKPATFLDRNKSILHFQKIFFDSGANGLMYLRCLHPWLQMRISELMHGVRLSSSWRESWHHCKLPQHSRTQQGQSWKLIKSYPSLSLFHVCPWNERRKIVACWGFT